MSFRFCLLAGAKCEKKKPFFLGHVSPPGLWIKTIIRSKTSGNAHSLRKGRFFGAALFLFPRQGRNGKHSPPGAAAMSAFPKAHCRASQESIHSFPLFFAVSVYHVEFEIPGRDFFPIRGFQQPYLSVAICFKFPSSGVFSRSGNTPMFASFKKCFRGDFSALLACVGACR